VLGACRRPIVLAKAELLRTILRRNSTSCAGNACSRCLNTPKSVSGYTRGNFTLDGLASRVRPPLPLPSRAGSSPAIMKPSVPMAKAPSVNQMRQVSDPRMARVSALGSRCYSESGKGDPAIRSQALGLL
jgi:hypothetical protein